MIAGFYLQPDDDSLEPSPQPGCQDAVMIPFLGSGKSEEKPTHLSLEKHPPTFHYTGWLVGILMMVYYNPYIIG